MMLKPSQVAADLGMSRFSIYNWITNGVIPEECISRAGQSIRLDGDRLSALVREGKIYRKRQRTPRLKNPAAAFVIRSAPVRSHAGGSARNDAHGEPRPARQLERTLAVMTLLRTAEEVRAGRQ
jgi:hypothetical protein